MTLQHTSPVVKFENSPAESFLSTPGDLYPPLFAVTTPTPSTMNPMEVMTPESFSEEKNTNTPANPPAALDTPPDSPAPESEKKPSKKRKSWGQILPEPKTNLPPRKRAKTEDEKEQRRVERVLRNRRAAQSSRERKRLEVESLEKRNKVLEAMLVDVRKTNSILLRELQRFRSESGIVTRSSTTLDSFLDNSVTLSQELFGSKDGQKTESPNSLLDDILTSNPTVNPASLSPELGPVADSLQETPRQQSIDAEAPEQTSATSPDLTQCPAETLYDLQCHMSAEMAQSLPASRTSMAPALAWLLQLRVMVLSALTILSVCHQPMTQIAFSSTAGFSLLPTPQLLTTIIWLVTLTSTPLPSQTSTSSTSSSMVQTLRQRMTTSLRTLSSPSRSTTLRVESLRKILSSSPSLARPLLDATLTALRLVSERCDNQVGISRCESHGTRDEDRELTQYLSSVDLPSEDALMALYCALKVEEWRMRESCRAPVKFQARFHQQSYHRDISYVTGDKRKMTSAGL